MRHFKPVFTSFASPKYTPEKKNFNYNTTLKSKTYLNNKSLSSLQTNQKKNKFNTNTPEKPRVLSVSQLLARLRFQRQKKKEQQKRGSFNRSLKPIIPPKSLIIILKEKPEKALYNRRIIDYKHCGLLQRYIGLGGKILPRRQTRLTAKQQRYVAKTIKSARVMALLPFVSKDKGIFQ